MIIRWLLKLLQERIKGCLLAEQVPSKELFLISSTQWLLLTYYVQSYYKRAQNGWGSFNNRGVLLVKREWIIDTGLPLAISVVVQWKEMACSGPLLSSSLDLFPLPYHMCWQFPFIVWVCLIPISEKFQSFHLQLHELNRLLKDVLFNICIFKF